MGLTARAKYCIYCVHSQSLFCRYNNMKTIGSDWPMSSPRWETWQALSLESYLNWEPQNSEQLILKTASCLKKTRVLSPRNGVKANIIIYLNNKTNSQLLHVHQVTINCLQGYSTVTELQFTTFVDIHVCINWQLQFAPRKET